MKYHTFFFRKLEKMLQNLSSAAVVIGALRDIIPKLENMSQNLSSAAVVIGALWAKRMA